jgi:hypothetical protein
VPKVNAKDVRAADSPIKHKKQPICLQNKLRMLKLRFPTWGKAKSSLFYFITPA